MKNISFITEKAVKAARLILKQQVESAIKEIVEDGETVNLDCSYMGSVIHSITSKDDEMSIDMSQYGAGILERNTWDFTQLCLGEKLAIYDRLIELSNENDD